MNTKDQSRIKPDAIILVVLVELSGLIFLMSVSFFSVVFRVALMLSLLLSAAVAYFGKDRKIGFLGAFLTSILLSPLFGIIITMGSAKLEDERYKQRMLVATEKSTAQSNIADQLFKLDELRKNGILTDEEFAVQKEKLLNS